MAEKVAVDVQDWNLADYPDRDPRNGKPGSTWWRMAYLDKDGRTAFKTVKVTMRTPDNQTVTVEQNAGPRRWDITGGIGSSGVKKGWQGQPSSYIDPVDLKFGEKECGGKPTAVTMGLFYEPQFNDDGQILEWLAQDRKVSHVPKYWRDMTAEYYAEMRPEAYKVGIDPYKNQRRPYTQLQEMRQANEDTRKKLEAENADLKKRLEAKR
jgi:hypothetical protein